MRSPHDINVNNGELLEELNTWTKHDGSRECPVPMDRIVQVETWTKHTHITYLAKEINWRAVKFYRIVEQKK